MATPHIRSVLEGVTRGELAVPGSNHAWRTFPNAQPRRQNDGLPRGRNAKMRQVIGHLARASVAGARRHLPDTFPLLSMCRLPHPFRFNAQAAQR